jgi:integration host factor subunit beta
MTKAELIDRISEKKPGLTRKQVEVVVNTVLDSIKFALAKEDKVEIRGFGSFRIRHRRAKEGRIPRPAKRSRSPLRRSRSSRPGRKCARWSTARSEGLAPLQGFSRSE